MENQSVKMSEEPQHEEPQNKEPQSAHTLKRKTFPNESELEKKGAKARWNKQKAEPQGLGKDLQPVQETEQPNEVKLEPQETTQSATPQLYRDVFKNYIPLYAVLI